MAEAHYTPRLEKPGKLVAYKLFIEERLTQYPELTAVRLYSEISSAGYARGMSQLRAFVRRTRPQAIVDPAVRFETSPAHAAQVDFTEFQ